MATVYALSDANATFSGAPYPAFLRDLIHWKDLSGWTWRDVRTDYFFTNELASAPAGSVVLLSSFDLEDRALVPMHAEELQDRLLSTPRQWQLMNYINPLILLIYDASGCTLNWPASSHHLLYLTTWCGPWHTQWLMSQRLEPPGSVSGRWPWLRSAPFGPAYDGGHLASLSAERRAADTRNILFAFRGTWSRYKRFHLLQAVEMNRDALSAIAYRTLRTRAPHPSGVGPFVLDMVRVGSPYATGEQISYLELLRSAIFTISPPGDLWEAWRTWEAMEAGSIPIVLEVADATYGNCKNASGHFLATAEGVLSVTTWDDLPELIAREASNMTAVRVRQQSMLRWLLSSKQAFRRDLLSAAATMRSGDWKPQTPCHTSPLTAIELASHHSGLGAYWRLPQPVHMAPRTGWASRYPYKARPWHGVNGWCSAKNDTREDFRERCQAKPCGVPLVTDFSCAKVASTHLATKHA